jgi:hypothetical protein
MFSYYGNVGELIGLYVGCFRHINDLRMFFLHENCHLHTKVRLRMGNI